MSSTETTASSATKPREIKQLPMSGRVMALFVGGVMDGKVHPMGVGARAYQCSVDDAPIPGGGYSTYFRLERYLPGIVVFGFLDPPRKLLVFVEEQLQKKQDHIPEILQAAEKAREESPRFHAAWESGEALRRKTV